MHFGVFVSLALFLTYRDWRVIVFGAVLYAIHHVVFDRLQAAGFGLYCITEANFGRVVIHSVYVVIQSGVQSIMAINMSPGPTHTRRPRPAGRRKRRDL